jgi:hypothetical protein
VYPSTPVIIEPEPLYRPFATVSPIHAAPHEKAQRRSLSYGNPKTGESSVSFLDQLSEEVALLPHSGSWNSPSTRSDPTTANALASPPVWDDFEKTGFAESPDTVDLTLSPSMLNLSSPLALDSASSLSQGRRPRFQTITSTRTPVYTAEREEIMEVDDLFMTFTEDGQLDKSSTKSWPHFALLRLNETLSGTSSEKSIEWLLITLEYRPKQTNTIPRTASPTGRSAISRMSTSFRISSLANSFRRSASYGANINRSGGGLRKSLFGGSSRTLTRTGQLATSPDNPANMPRSSPSTLDRVGGMGELRLDGVPSELLPSGSQVSWYTRSVGCQTLPTDWQYKAEGGAHLIYTYVGGSSEFKGKVLRVRKTSAVKHDTDTTNALRTEWRENGLARVMPSEFLLQSEEVFLRSEWVAELLKLADGHRPAVRKVKDIDVSTLGTVVRAYLMEDLMGSSSDSGETSFCIEIKVSVNSSSDSLWHLTPKKAKVGLPPLTRLPTAS